MSLSYDFLISSCLYSGMTEYLCLSRVIYSDFWFYNKTKLFLKD